MSDVLFGDNEEVLVDHGTFRDGQVKITAPTLIHNQILLDSRIVQAKPAVFVLLIRSQLLHLEINLEMWSKGPRLAIFVDTGLGSVFFLEIGNKVGLSAGGARGRALSVWLLGVRLLLLLLGLLALACEVLHAVQGSELNQPLFQFKLAEAPVKPTYVNFEAISFIETFLLCLGHVVVFFGQRKLHLRFLLVE